MSYRESWFNGIDRLGHGCASCLSACRRSAPHRHKYGIDGLGHGCASCLWHVVALLLTGTNMVYIQLQPFHLRM